MATPTFVKQASGSVTSPPTSPRSRDAHESTADGVDGAVSKILPSLTRDRVAKQKGTRKPTLQTFNDRVTSPPASPRKENGAADEEKPVSSEQAESAPLSPPSTATSIASPKTFIPSPNPLARALPNPAGSKLFQQFKHAADAESSSATANSEKNPTSAESPISPRSANGQPALPPKVKPKPNRAPPPPPVKGVSTPNPELAPAPADSASLPLSPRLEPQVVPPSPQPPTTAPSEKKIEASPSIAASSTFATPTPKPLPTTPPQSKKIPSATQEELLQQLFSQSVVESRPKQEKIQTFQRLIAYVNAGDNNQVASFVKDLFSKTLEDLIKNKKTKISSTPPLPADDSSSPIAVQKVEQLTPPMGRSRLSLVMNIFSLIIVSAAGIIAAYGYKVLQQATIKKLR